MVPTSIQTESNGNDSGIFSDIVEEHQAEERARARKDAVGYLAGFLEPERNVGDLISMDYDTAEVLVHDRLRQDVGGVPRGCLLIATRIKLDPDDETLDLEAPETSLILLRALGQSPLPNRVETDAYRLQAGQRVAQTQNNWDEPGSTDQFTLDQMRYAGAHCRILGTFRMRLPEEGGKWRLEFGGDIDNFYAGQGMKVYKPSGEALRRIVNYPDESLKRAEIGKIRYAASIRNPDAPESVPVRITPEDMIARRTALFGMTRTGKSNTAKTIANAIFMLRENGGQRVGQLIFDPNGEYANENPQDQGCIRNIANLADEFAGDVTTYGLYPHPNDPGRKITKFNFFGNAVPQGGNPGKGEYDEALQGLYQGKAIIDDALGEETAGYINSFINVDIRAPANVSAKGPATRYLRQLFVYKSALAWAGFPTPDSGISVARLFSEKIQATMKKSADMRPHVDNLERGWMTWDAAQNFCQSMSEWVSTGEFEKFDREYSRGSAEGRNWSDDKLLGLLQIFTNPRGRGRSTMQNARQWHDPSRKSDYVEDIVRDIRNGKLVIIDQALGDQKMKENAAAQIARRILVLQQQAFVKPKIDPETGKAVEPPPVIIYLEEAHTLLPRGSEEDATNIWARLAKEGAKFNIGMVYSTQEPSSIQTNILKNTENWFIAHLNNTDETRQLDKYNDFADFTPSVIKVNEVGFLRVRSLSSPYTLPVQINKFSAPHAVVSPPSVRSTNGGAQTSFLGGGV